jgi:predicted membrane protein
VPDFLKNWALLVALGGLAIFGLSTLLFTPDQMSDATAVVMIVACVAGLWRWAPTGWRVFWRGARRTEDWGILGLCLVLTTILAGRVYGIIFRQLDRPEWLVQSYWSPFFLYTLLCAVTLLVAATKSEKDP